MIYIKPGAKLNGLRPEIQEGRAICVEVFREHKLDFIITEGTGSKHGRASLHYVGLAIDIRSKHIGSRALKYKILEECRRRLGEQFDIILEAEGRPNEHYHLEYQPK